MSTQVDELFAQLMEKFDKAEKDLVDAQFKLAHMERQLGELTATNETLERELALSREALERQRVG